MFTGLIREMAAVKRFGGDRLSLKASYRPKLGDSIAINGTCLSVVSIESDGFTVELSPETQGIVATENFQGNIVQGHIDTVGTVRSVTDNGNSVDVVIDVDKKFIPYIVPKGSIAIDGVSLTVNDVYESGFRLTIIPITMRETLFGSYKKGSRVNIETDMFARYIAHFLTHKGAAKLDWETAERFTSLY